MGKTLEEQQLLKQELEQAEQHIEVGAQYRHYKAAHKIYKVLHLAFQEEDNELSVIYQAEYDERLIFIRPVLSWLEDVEWEGETVPRFSRLES